MEQYIDKAALVAEIEKYISNYRGILNNIDKSSDDWVDSTLILEPKIDVLQHILSFLDTLEVKEVKEEPVSNDLEEASDNYVGHAPEIDEDLSCFIRRNAFIAGAQWKKEQMITKACVFLESTDFCKYYNKEFVEEFKKAMEE